MFDKFARCRLCTIYIAKGNTNLRNKIVMYFLKNSIFQKIHLFFKIKNKLLFFYVNLKQWNAVSKQFTLCRIKAFHFMYNSNKFEFQFYDSKTFKLSKHVPLYQLLYNSFIELIQCFLVKKIFGE